MFLTFTREEIACSFYLMVKIIVQNVFKKCFVTLEYCVIDVLFKEYFIGWISVNDLINNKILNSQYPV